MPLFKPGERVCGRFTVEALIGTGGMSEVYRGRDEKLHDRAVAIKVLRARSLDSAAIRERIQAEVRSLSALTHPHIGVLYDVCSHDGLDVMVMELVEGKTLAAILRKGRLSETEALRYAVQVAAALAYAHEHGFIHRDVKPSNIMIGGQGAKLLDFGLAHLMQPAVEAGSTPVATDQPTPAGTPFYMSPEQSAGAAIDERTDIYAFGLVLCQMLTGFDPQAVSELSTRTLIAGLLEQISSRPLRLVVERCLASNPEDRWLHAGDLRHALLVVGETRQPSPPAVISRRRSTAAALAVTSIAAAIAMLIGWSMAGGERPVAEYQFTVSPTPGTHFVSLEMGGPAIVSPNGDTIAFVAADGAGTTRIWTRPLRALEATPLYGTEGASHPFWSPDSRFIGYFAGGQLQRIAATGGPPRVIAPADAGRGASWSADDVIVFAPGFTEPLYRVPADGGTVERVTALDFSVRETSHRWPAFLPDGRRFLFFVRSDQAEVLGLYLGSLDSRERVRVGTIPSSATYAAGSDGEGYLVFAQQGFVTAQRFSAPDGRLAGEPFRVAQLVAPEEDTSVSAVSVSSTGVLVHRGGSGSRQVLTWVDRAGRELSAVTAQGQYRNVRLSPDGRRVALERLEIRTGLAYVWVFDLERNVQQRFDSTPGASYSPVWSPDGQRLIFASYRGAQWDLVNSVGTGDATVLRPGQIKPLTERLAQAGTDWSRDGKWVVYQERVPGNQWNVGAIEVQTGTTRTLLDTPYNEHQAHLSPDGSLVAYTSNESGREEIYLAGFPSMIPRVRVSTAGGSQPRWRGDGRELFYVAPDQTILSVDVRAAPLTLGSNRALFRVDMAPEAGLNFIANYDVDRTGARFLIARPPTVDNAEPRLGVMVNWLAGAPPR